MSTSRRSFLKKGTILALAAGVPLKLAKDAAAESLISSPATQVLSKKDFAACLNTEFVVQSAGNKFRTKLVQITDLKRPRNIGSHKEGFSLTFRGERSRELKQNTYVIEHERLGKFSFLLVPTITEDKEKSYYVATVNRLFP